MYYCKLTYTDPFLIEKKKPFNKSHTWHNKIGGRVTVPILCEKQISFPRINEKKITPKTGQHFVDVNYM